MNEDDLIQAITEDDVIRMAGLLPLLMHADGGVGFGVKGLDGRYRLANPMLERLLGQHPGQLAGKSESELLPPNLLAPLLRSDQRILAGAATASEEVDLPDDGHYLWLRLPILGPDRRLRSIASVIFEHSPRAPRQPAAAVQQTLDSLQQANRELQRTVVELEQVASTDKLTGAWNRRRLEECVRSELGRFERYQHPLSLLILDIDFFKAINDRHGHGTGDQVLQSLTRRLQGGLRATDALARWGGEEFVVLCPDTNRATAATLAERLREQIAQASFADVDRLTISIGVAECRAGETWDEWFQRADEALYRAKAAGRNQVQLAPEAALPADAGDYLVANFVQLVWRSAYECGDEAIDRGHRLLFSDANELLAAILSGQAAERVNTMVDRLLTDVLEHFHDEETVFVAAGYPRAEEHIAMHRDLVSQSLKMAAAFRAGTQGVGDVFKYLAHDVITRHLLSEDRKFFDHLRRQRPLGA
ncbi:MAG: diguanylate cyclase [Rhodobacteraceae bacterium]|nr:diguanylate cyclase [Paracoccaceae bacterium]